MGSYRLTRTAQSDIVSILAWSHEQFGGDARHRYEALIVAAIKDAAMRGDDTDSPARPELGEGVFCWHLARSRTGSSGGIVHRPRHLLVCRRDGVVLVVGRVLHAAMDVGRHLDTPQSWE